MRIAPFTADEESRLASLGEYALEAGDMEAEAEKIIELAASLFEVPIVLISLVERERQIFAARRGLDACETGRDVSFCSHVILQTDVMVVLDASLDPRFHDNPLVTGGPKVRFYAGAPLISPNGQILGTFCLVDSKPKSTFSEADRRNLADFAALVLEKMELRRLEHARRMGLIRFEQIAATSPDSIICTDGEGLIHFWNPAATALFGYTPEEILGQPIDLVLPGHTRLRPDHLPTGNLPCGPNPKGAAAFELEGKRQNGSTFLAGLCLSLWPDRDSISFGSIVRDVSERRAHEDRLFHLAYHDCLTQLPNRTVLRSRIEQSAQAPGSVSVIALDLDGFKGINDALGHSAGDLLLKQVAARLLACVRSTDTVARIGGDEFAILLPHPEGPDFACAVADASIRSLAKPFLIEGVPVHVGASAGIATYPSDSTNTSDLLSNADLALYQAKSEGKHRRRTFTPQLRQAAVGKRAWVDRLRQAHADTEFELFYQPQVNLATGALSGAEALLRWRHPEQGLLPPGKFLPSLENSVLATEVGEWVIQQACIQTAAWRRLAQPDFRIGVNLFGAQFRAGDLAGKVRSILADVGLAPSALELEITENIILQHDDAMTVPLRELRADGVGIAFDDYGTGYASLSLLKRYPLTRLKIDQTFIRDICTSTEDAAIVRAVLHLGRAFHIEVIAEGVETEEQCASLRRKGCEQVQGYLFGRPMPASEFEALFFQRSDALTTSHPHLEPPASLSIPHPSPHAQPHRTLA